jgi:hypothetical protein
MGDFTVTTLNDENDGGAGGSGLSLREALALANGNPDVSTITFAHGLAGGTLFLQQGLLAVSTNVTINGDTDNDGDADITISADSQAGANDATSGIFLISDGAASTIAATLNGLVLRDGRTSIGGAINVGVGDALTLTNATVTDNNELSAGAGAGIFAAEAASVTVIDSTLSDNVGGAIFIGNGGSVTVDGSTITGNQTLSSGGAIHARFDVNVTVESSTIADNYAALRGGGIYGARRSTIALTDSVVSGNGTGINGGGIFADGDGPNAAATITLTNSSLIGNFAFGDGLLILAPSRGGGIYAGHGVAITLTNATVAGNAARRDGGGIYGFGENPITLTNSTVTGNSSGANGGGIYNYAGVNTLINSIVAGNAAALAGDDIFGGDIPSVLAFQGGNIPGSAPVNVTTTGAPTLTIDGASRSALQTIFATVALVDPDGANGNPAFYAGVPADNGGPVPTVALTASSFNPALDGGDDTLALLKDARGISRFDFAVANNGTNISDLGAFEVRPNTAPTLVLNGGLTLDEGGNATITDAVLTFSDAEQGADAIRFTVTAVPTAGTLFLGNTALQAGASFTQDDIDRDRVAYAHDGSETTTDAFGFTVTDGFGGTVSGRTFTFTIGPVNDAPILDPAGSMALTTIGEDIAAAANTGTLVSAIIASAGGDRITDADAGALEGIAITAVDDGNGTWQFSIDGGATWTDLGTPDASHARLLAADALVRFVPDADFNGTVDPAITFRGWDQASGQNSDVADASTGGGASAFSAEFETATIVVTEVNDGPVAVDDTLDAVEEDSGSRAIAFDDLTGNDSTGPSNEISQVLAMTAVDNPVGGVVDIVGGNVVFTPDADFFGTASFTYTVQDDGTTNGGADALTATATVTFEVTAVNDAPGGNLAGGTIQYIEDQAATALDPSLTVTDPDDTHLEGAQVAITGNFTLGQDVLAFTPQFGITGSYDAATGVLTLSGHALLAEYETVLRSVTYFNGSQNPLNLPRTVSFEVDDGGGLAAMGSVGVDVIPQLDPPSDFNGDHTTDVVWREDTGRVALWEMDGVDVLANNGIADIPNYWDIVDANGDFDGDGNSDILWQDDAGVLVLWTMDGPTILSNTVIAGTPAFGAMPAYWHIADTGDFTGDGNTDILWRDDAGRVVLWEMNGATIVNNALVADVPITSVIEDTADFNGDGMNDILWRDPDGTVRIWEMDGAAVVSDTTVATLGDHWHVEGTGDFNGDARSDILWRDTAGTVVLWEMDGATITSNTALGTIPTHWQIADIGDYTGDLHSDILWRDTAGTVVLWELNGPVVADNTVANMIPCTGRSRRRS